MTQSETVGVVYRVLGIERVTNAGRLLALANVEVEIGGVTVTLQGVSVRRQPGGGLGVVGPVFRHPRDGRWLPGVLFPKELESALADEVIEYARNELGL